MDVGIHGQMTMHGGVKDKCDEKVGQNSDGEMKKDKIGVKSED